MRRARRRDLPPRHHGRHPDRLAGSAPAGALALLGDRLTDAALDELERLAEELERHDICGVTMFPTLPELAETLARTGRAGEARATRDTWRRRVGPTRRPSRPRSRPDSMVSAPSPSTTATPTSRPPKPCSQRCRTPSSWPGPSSIGANGCDAPGDAATPPGAPRGPRGFQWLGARAWRAQADAELGPSACDRRRPGQPATVRGDAQPPGAQGGDGRIERRGHPGHRLRRCSSHPRPSRPT